MTETLRNGPCPCGSGKRYKHCCGRLGAEGPVAGADADADAPEAWRLMHAALDAQQRRRLDDAERLYRAALAITPDATDALHMLGVIRYERHDYDEALGLIVRALDLTGWSIQSFRHNLALVLARTSGVDAAELMSEKGRAYRKRPRGRTGDPGSAGPLVSVVVPSFNHDRYVEEALQSVFDQSYRNLELVVVDDGSTDRSPDVIRAALRRSPYPHRFVARENRGAAATINEGIGLAAGPWVNILNSDDRFPPERIATMVTEVAAPAAEWSFAACSFIDEAGQPADLLQDRRAYELSCAISAVPLVETVGFALLAQNVAVSTGNLFFTRELWRKLHGFRDLRYNHDWDFCLRALWEHEPVFVPEPLYIYRLHRGNTIGESPERPRAETHSFFADYLRRTLATDEAAPNVYAPCVRHWGMRYVVAVLGGGMGGLVDPELLRTMALSHRPEREPQSAAGV